MAAARKAWQTPQGQGDTAAAWLGLDLEHDQGHKSVETSPEGDWNLPAAIKASCLKCQPSGGESKYRISEITGNNLCDYSHWNSRIRLRSLERSQGERKQEIKEEYFTFLRNNKHSGIICISVVSFIIPSHIYPEQCRNTEQIIPSLYKTITYISIKIQDSPL